MYNERQVKNIQRLLEAKHSAAEIARKIGISRQRVSKIIGDYLPNFRPESRSAKPVKSSASTKVKRFGRQPSSRGLKLRNGRAQVVCLMRPKTKHAMIAAASRAKLPLSNYMVIAAAKHANISISTQEFAELAGQAIAS